MPNVGSVGVFALRTCMVRTLPAGRGRFVWLMSSQNAVLM